MNVTITWLLIYVVMAAHGTTTGTVEFLNQDACKYAGEQLSQQLNGNRLLEPFHYICVAKNAPPEGIVVQP